MIPALRCLLVLLLVSNAKSQTDSARERPPVLAHYMPWYASKEVSGQWGWHWTMDHFDPDTIRWNGKREAASKDYPLIGLYDSGDPDALECHALLMKFAGIDGVIIDWYGTKDFYDYGKLHENTKALIPFLKKAGLKFAICYEDQSVAALVLGNQIQARDSADHARQQIKWMQENWFEDEAYFKVNNRPVLLVFGPQHFEKERWGELFLGLPDKPLTYTLPHLFENSGAKGAFGWPPVDGGKHVNEEVWTEYLTDLYADEANVGVVFPGFNDIYEQAGESKSYGHIADQNGATFSKTLNLALKSEAPFAQIATWNDFGEGTVIEPTHNLGYRYLDELQTRLKAPYASDDLRLPVTLYRLRKAFPGSSELDKAADAMFEGNPDKAIPILEKFSRANGESPVTQGSKYHLISDIAYRSEDTDSYARNRCRMNLYYPKGQKDFSTVIWFHGGGITKGNLEIPVPLREKGVAVLAANYRLNPKVTSPTYIDDAAAVVAWAFENISSYGGSVDSIFVSGHSAGGYLASMVGLDPGYLEQHQIDANKIAGLIPFSGHTITHFTIRSERGIPGHQAIVDKMAPLFHARSDAPPILLITGDKEKELMGRYDENAYFARMMKVAGHKETSLIELEGFDHGGMPEPAFPLLLKFVDKHSKK